MRVTSYRIYPHLHQGPVPASAEAVIESRFTVLVLCAQEIQPWVPPYERLTVLRCPLVDDASTPLSDTDWALAVATATEVAKRVQSGRERVLTTCAAGLNRSGLVNAVALHMLTGASGNDAIYHIRQRRGMSALSNGQFVRRIQRLPRRQVAARAAV